LEKKEKKRNSTKNPTNFYNWLKDFFYLLLLLLDLLLEELLDALALEDLLLLLLLAAICFHLFFVFVCLLYLYEQLSHI
jgi:hypothetical protein